LYLATPYRSKLTKFVSQNQSLACPDGASGLPVFKQMSGHGAGAEQISENPRIWLDLDGRR
jgi:hypothetical protein